MKPTFLFLTLILALSGCKAENPALGVRGFDENPELDMQDLPDEGSPSILDGSIEEPDLPRGRPGDVTRPLDLGASDPDATREVQNPDLIREIPDAGLDSDSTLQDAFLPDAEVDANSLGCQARGAGCPDGQICDSYQQPAQCVPDTICDLPESPPCRAGLVCDAHNTRLCVALCDGVVLCPADAPFCISAHPPFWATTCGQCIDDFSCPEGHHCTDSFLCERDGA